MAVEPALRELVERSELDLHNKMSGNAEKMHHCSSQLEDQDRKRLYKSNQGN